MQYRMYTEANMRYKLAHVWHSEDSLNSDKVALLLYEVTLV